jgi:hypothetical protein
MMPSNSEKSVIDINCLLCYHHSNKGVEGKKVEAFLPIQRAAGW